MEWGRAVVWHMDAATATERPMSKAKSKAAVKRFKKLSISIAPRERSGRRQRGHNRITETANAARETVVAARRKHHGLTDKQAKDQDAATFIGRAFMLGDLSKAQKQTAEWFDLAYRQHQNAILSPGRARGKPGFTHPDSDEYEAYCIQAKRRWDGIAALLRERDIAMHTTNSLGVLDAAIIRDADCYHYIGDLREVLNVIERWKSGTGEESSCNDAPNQNMVILVRTA